MTEKQISRPVGIAVFWQNFVISILYMTFCCAYFIFHSGVQVIAAGILYMTSMLLHVVCMLISYLYLWLSSKRKISSKKWLLMASLGVAVPNLIFLLFSNPIWDLLWKIKSS